MIKFRIPMRKFVLTIMAVIAMMICDKATLSAQDYIYWGNPRNYLDNQAREAFEAVEQALSAYPPEVQCNAARRNALITLDMLLHDTSNDKSQALFDFFERRFTQVAEQLENGPAPQKDELWIYKMYNDGFILRSSSATVAIDLIRGGGATGRHFIGDTLIRRIADCCDLLLITHSHGDHFDAGVAQLFKQEGKKVFTWADTDPVGVKEVSLKIIPGHQDDMPNNIYHITFSEGMSVAHTGDQYNSQDIEWISHLRESYKTDVLLINCWTMKLQETIAGFNPKYVITGHENELEHSIDHREAYWMTLRKMEQTHYPNVLMTFGEKWSLRKTAEIKDLSR